MSVINDLISLSAPKLDINQVHIALGPQPKIKNRSPGINLKYGDSRKNFQIKLDESNVRFMSYTDEQSGKATFNLSYTLTGCDPFGKERATGNDNISKLYNFLLDLEEEMIQEAVKNSDEWFGSTRSEEGIRDSFNRIINVSKEKVGNKKVANGKYPPSLRIKVPVYEGEVKLNEGAVINSQGKVIEKKDLTVENLPTLFPNYSTAKLAIVGSGYIVNKSFGVSWRLQLAQVFQKQKLNASELFMNDEETNEEETTEEQSSQQVSVPEERPATPPQTTEPTVAPNAPARKRRGAANA